MKINHGDIFPFEYIICYIMYRNWGKMYEW